MPIDELDELDELNILDEQDEQMKLMNKTWFSVSNSSLVRTWFQSKKNLHFKMIFVQQFLDLKQILAPGRIWGSKNFGP